METQANYSTQESILRSVKKVTRLENFCKLINSENLTAELISGKITQGVEIPEHIRIEGRSIDLSSIHALADASDVEISNNIQLYTLDDKVVCLMVVRY